MTNILFIEDDMLDQMAFQRFVKRHNLAYSYTIVDTVAAALEQLETEPYDVILSDYHLKDGTAFDFIEAADSLPAPLIFMTGAGAEEIAVRALKTGAKDYIVKGLENEHLDLIPLTIEKVIRAQRSEELLHFTQFERSVAGVVKTKCCGEIIGCNETFAQLAGFLSERQLLQDRSWCSAFQKRFESTRLALKQNGGFLTNFELEFRAKQNNVVHVLANITHIAGHEPQEELIQATVVDISKLKAEELARQEKEKEVDELQEALRIRENLSSMIVHDLRNPLSIISLSANLIDQISEDEDVLALTNRILRRTEELEELINEMLTIARIERGELALATSKEDFVLNSKMILDRFQPLAQRHDIALIFNPCVDQLIANYDVKLLQRVLDNLLSNAIKFAPVGSHVTLTIERGRSGPSADPTLRFSVADEGAGIHPEDRSLIFEQFKTGSNRAKRGNQIGLGLPFCKMVVEAHHGTIAVTDNQPHGALFTVDIPLEVQLRASSPTLLAEKA